MFALVTSLTVIFTRGVQVAGLCRLASLVAIGLWAYHFPKIGVAFMPALDEGTTLDMPITVPRASVTQAADDLKARDALLRGFPEVESVIGKAGRADTPTDPAPLDMVETFVNFRPKELWPKRVLRYDDASGRPNGPQLARPRLRASRTDSAPDRPRSDDDRRSLDQRRDAKRRWSGLTKRCASWRCCDTRNSSSNCECRLDAVRSRRDVVRQMHEAGRRRNGHEVSRRPKADRDRRAGSTN